VYTDAAGWQHKRKRSEGGKIKKIWTRILKRTRRKIRPIQEPRKRPLNSARNRSSWASSLAVDYSGGGGVVVSSLSDVLCSALYTVKGKEGGGREESGSGISAHLPPDHHHPPSFMAAVSCQTPAPWEKIDPPFFFSKANFSPSISPIRQLVQCYYTESTRMLS
jgi:hypothetical protein